MIQLAQDLVEFSETLAIEIETDQLIKRVSDYYLQIKPW
jgi:negative regulator of genetic competence, sporulation and motility